MAAGKTIVTSPETLEQILAAEVKPSYEEAVEAFTRWVERQAPHWPDQEIAEFTKEQVLAMKEGLVLMTAHFVPFDMPKEAGRWSEGKLSGLLTRIATNSALRLYEDATDPGHPAHVKLPSVVVGKLHRVLPRPCEAERRWRDLVATDPAAVISANFGQFTDERVWRMQEAPVIAFLDLPSINPMYRAGDDAASDPGQYLSYGGPIRFADGMNYIVPMRTVNGLSHDSFHIAATRLTRACQPIDKKMTVDKNMARIAQYCKAKMVEIHLRKHFSGHEYDQISPPEVSIVDLLEEIRKQKPLGQVLDETMDAFQEGYTVPRRELPEIVDYAV